MSELKERLQKTINKIDYDNLGIYKKIELEDVARKLDKDIVSCHFDLVFNDKEYLERVSNLEFEYEKAVFEKVSRYLIDRFQNSSFIFTQENFNYFLDLQRINSFQFMLQNDKLKHKLATWFYEERISRL